MVAWTDAQARSTLIVPAQPTQPAAFAELEFSAALAPSAELSSRRTRARTRPRRNMLRQLAPAKFFTVPAKFADAIPAAASSRPASARSR